MARDMSVTLTLSEDLLLALGRAAQDMRVQPSDYVRAVVQMALDRNGFALPGDEDAVRVALHLATGWPDLQKRLRAQGRVLRAGPGGELFVHSWPQERRLLPLALFGASREGLTLRFGTGFPPTPGVVAFRSSRRQRTGQPKAA